MKSQIIQFILIPVFILVFYVGSLAQSSSRKFEKFEDTGNKINVMVSDGRYEIIPFNDQIVHTTFYPKEKESKKFSYAVEQEPAKVVYQINDVGNLVSINMKGMKVRISKSPFQISYYNNKNRLLIAENQGYQSTDTSQLCNFSIQQSEILYGGGARVLGMNRRGNRLQLYNRAHYGYETRSELMNYTLPMFISSNQYAVLFDNASSGFLDLDSKKNNTVNYETFGGTINYYVINGKDWYDLTNQYTWLTGRQPLPPRWAFGNFSSRFGYHSQKETETTVDRFFKDSIPLDAVIIDIYWFGKEIKGEMGNLEWFRDSFPEPEKMISRFKDKGVKTILVSEPFILTTSKRWNEAVDQAILGTDGQGKPYKFDFYFGNSGLIDLYKPEAREWFWIVYEKFTNQGIAGWWGDLGEPEMHPSGLRHAIGSADEVHNAYGHEWAKLIYQGFQKDFPDLRPFILMRAGYAGSQRYGMIPWTGDVSRSWGGLVPQPEISLQMGMQGIAYMHSDLGGFAGGEVFDPELYTRWLQYGVFQPIYRPHAQEHIPAEPVFQDERTKVLAKKSIELRYRLLPYLYNMAFENNQTGKPLMIPLFFNETNNHQLLTYDSAYMWGDAFLVSPVKEKGKKEQNIYFPKGSNWYDFFGNGQYLGGKNYAVPLTIEHIPVFAKGGSFIPMCLKAENTEKYSLEQFEIHYFADPLIMNSSYSLYNDDGKTPNAYEKGNFEMIKFEALNKKEMLTIKFIKAKSGENFRNIKNRISLKIHHLNKKPLKIMLNGKALDTNAWKWNENGQLLEIPVQCSIQQGVVKIIK